MENTEAGGGFISEPGVHCLSQVAMSLPLPKVSRWDKKYKVSLSTHPTPLPPVLMPRQQMAPGFNFHYCRMGLITPCFRESVN